MNPNPNSETGKTTVENQPKSTGKTQVPKEVIQKIMKEIEDCAFCVVYEVEDDSNEENEL